AITAGEVDDAGVGGGGVAVSVLESGRAAGRDAGRAAGRGADRVMGGGSRADGNGGATVDGAGDGVGAGDRLAAAGLEGDAVREGVYAGVAADEGIIGRQAGLAITAGEVDDAGISGGGVAVSVL